jgi:hypothetical protein
MHSSFCKETVTIELKWSYSGMLRYVVPEKNFFFHLESMKMSLKSQAIAADLSFVVYVCNQCF